MRGGFRSYPCQGHYLYGVSCTKTNWVAKVFCTSCLINLSQDILDYCKGTDSATWDVKTICSMQLFRYKDGDDSVWQANVQEPSAPT